MNKFVYFLSFMLVFPVYAADRPLPDSWSWESRSMENLESRSFPALDLEQLAAEDSYNEAIGKPPRFAVARGVNVNPAWSGDWRTENGISVWRYRVQAEDAVSLNFGFKRLRLPDQARLFIYSTSLARKGVDDKYELLGPYGPEINKSHGEFWTPIIQAADVVIEIDVPVAQRDAVQFELVQVSQGYRAFGDAAEDYRQTEQHMGEGKSSCRAGAGGGVRSGTCNMDPACLGEDDPWNDPRRSVGAYTMSGTDTCTGSLVNNTNNDRTMFFATATHCGVTSGSAASIVVYWNYEWPSCREPGTPVSGDTNPPDPGMSSSGSTFVAATPSPFTGGGCSTPGDCSDFTLIELDEEDPAQYDVFWAGWSRSDVPAECGPQGAPGSTDGLCATIHHPSVDEKRITFVEQDFEPGDIAAASGVHWHAYWHPDPPVLPNIPAPQPSSIPPGVTEPGSSGSPLYNSNQQLVGVLSGGPAFCGATGEDLSDFYGQLAHAWEGLGTSSTRMSDHLDPAGTNPVSISGIGASPFILTADPASVAACATDGSVDIDIDIEPDPGFSDPVSLAIAGAPAGAGTNFSTNPVTPPGVSVLTMSALGTASPGSYTLEITGTSGDEESGVNVPFALNDAAPSQVSLVAPADGGGAAIQPNLEWTAAATGGPTDYTIEIATDSGFGDIVFTETVTGTTTLDVGPGLDSSTTYYWRVTAANGCGTAAASETFEFTTAAAPGDCPIDQVAVEYVDEDMESGAPGWMTSSATGPNTWVLDTSDANSPTTSYRGEDIDDISDQFLTTPEISMPSSPTALTLQYYGKRDMENDGEDACYDGGLLEFSTNGGSSWTQVDSGMLDTNPYTGPVDGGFMSPIAGLDAWCGEQDWTRTVVDLTGFEGQDVMFRFRLGTDESVAADDWHIDDFVVQSCELETIFIDGFEDPAPPM